MPGLFGGIPQQLSASDVTVTVNTGAGGLSPATLYFWCSLRNRVGLNLLYSLGSRTVASNDRIQITVATTVKALGEDARFVVISASATNDPSTAVQIADYDLYQNDQVTPRTLPVTFYLSQNSHLALSATVPTVGDLASVNAVEGALREVIATGDRYRYNGTDWEIWQYPFSTAVVTNITGINTGGAMGAYSQIASLENTQILPLPDKTANGDTIPLRLWFLNSTSEVDPDILTGTALSFQFAVNGATSTPSPELFDFDTLFANLVSYTLIGYYRLSDRSLDTGRPGVGSTLPWSKQNPISLLSNLPGGYAAVYDLVFNFDENQVHGRIKDGDVIQIKDFYSTGRYGTPSAVFALTGNVRYSQPEGNMRLQSGVRRAGSCTIEGYDTPAPYTPELLLGTVGLATDTVNQIATMMATIPGAVRFLPNPTGILENEAILAFVGTDFGVGPRSLSSTSVAAGANSTLTITLNHPVSSGRATIRADYPDIVAGDTDSLATAVANQITIFIFDGTNYWRTDAACAPSSVTENILIASLGTNVGTSLTGFDEAANFGLFKPNQPNIIAGGSGSIPSGTYSVIVAYYYPSPNIFFTSINHDPTPGAIYAGVGCISEVNVSLSDILANAPLKVQANDVLSAPTRSFLNFKPDFTITNNAGNDSHDVTISSALITGKATVTPVSGDLLLVADASDSFNLKKVDVANIVGQDAATTTTVNFTQPAIAATVSVQVGSTVWLSIQSIVLINDGTDFGWYRVTAIANDQSMTLENLGYPGSATAGTTINSGATVVANGVRGSTGATGSASVASTLELNHTTTPVPPSSGSLLLYAKNDDLVYIQDSLGSETVLGDGATIQDIWLYGGI